MSDIFKSKKIKIHFIIFIILNYLLTLKFKIVWTLKHQNLYIFTKAFLCFFLKEFSNSILIISGVDKYSS